jgi:DNA-binding response OmpR family regulator
VEEADRVAREQRLEGAILDVELHGRMCFSICSALRERQIPFMFLTGYVELSMMPSELHGTPIVVKPFEPHQMARTLDKMLRTARDGSCIRH